MSVEVQLTDLVTEEDDQVKLCTHGGKCRSGAQERFVRVNKQISDFFKNNFSLFLTPT